jgi:hypothetical protein
VHGPRQREPTKPRAPGDAVVHLQVGDREPAERTEQCEVVDPSRPEVEDPRGNTKTWGMRYTLFSHVMAIALAGWVKKQEFAARYSESYLSIDLVGRSSVC